MEDGANFVFLTDNELGYKHRGGLSFEDYADFIRGADLLVHDAEYDSYQYEWTRGWGHSLYTDALRLAVQAGVGRFGLFHHNQDRPDEAQDAIVLDCRRLLLDQKRNMECFALTQTTELTL